jgi:hypothetical protein
MMQALPAVGFGDTCFMATWSEGLDEPNIYAARISVSGNLIDSSGVQLSNSPDFDMWSSVGFDGTGYLVMWCEIDPAWETGSLCGRRVTVDGVPLDSGLIRPELAGYLPSFPSVASDTANFLVAFSAYETSNGDDNVFCTRISPGGVVLDPVTSFPVGVDAQSNPSGTSDGTNFLTTWLETRGQGDAVQAARISADGTMLDSIGFTVNDAPGAKYYLATGYGDSLYLVAWADYRGGDGPDIYCARVSEDGTVLDPDGIVLCDETSYQEWPDVSFDGQNFLVVWQDERSGNFVNIYGARVSPAGVVLDPNGFVVAADTFGDLYPAVCFTGTHHLVVWQGQSNRESNIYGALVSPAGVVTKPRFVVSGAAYEQMLPVVTRGPTNSLVAWVDARLSGYDIYAARVQADGTVLDPNGIVVAGTSDDEQMPRVTSDETGYRVIWSRWEYSDSTIFAVAQVDTAGNVTRTGDWFGLPGYDNGFDAVCGTGPELLLLFSCWTDTAMGHYYGVDRLWGKLDQVPGIEQDGNPQLGNMRVGPTIVSSVLVLPEASSRKPQAASSLLDISGRKVMSLRPGANDVSALSPGVYFVRQSSGVERAASSVTKIVLTE